MELQSSTYQPQLAQVCTVTLTGCPSPIWCEVLECRIYLLRVHNTQIKQHNIHEAALKQLGSSKAPSSSFDLSSTTVKSSLTRSYFSSLKLKRICLHIHEITPLFICEELYSRPRGHERRYQQKMRVCTTIWEIYEIRERRETMQRKKNEERGCELNDSASWVILTVDERECKWMMG